MSPKPRRRATRCLSGRRVESSIFDQHGAVVCLRKRRQQHGWRCSQHHEISVCSFIRCRLFPSLRQTSRWNVSGVDRRETGLFFAGKTTSLSGITRKSCHSQTRCFSNEVFDRCLSMQRFDVDLASSSLDDVRAERGHCLVWWSELVTRQACEIGLSAQRAPALGTRSAGAHPPPP